MFYLMNSSQAGSLAVAAALAGFNIGFADVTVDGGAARDVEQEDGRLTFAVDADAVTQPATVRITGDIVEPDAMHWINLSDHPPRLVRADSDGTLELTLPWAINTHFGVEPASEPLLVEAFEGGMPGNWRSDIDTANLRPVLKMGHEGFDMSPTGEAEGADAVRAESADDVGRDGSGAIRVIKPSVGGSADLVHEPIAIEQGTEYLAEAFYSVEEMAYGGNASFGVELLGDDGSFKRYAGYSSMSPLQRNREGQWRRGYTRFTPREGEVRARIRLSTSGSPVQILWDDARITKSPTRLTRMPNDLPADRGAAKMSEQEVRDMLASEEPLSAEVRTVNGYPTTFVNGEPVGNFHFNAGFYDWGDAQPQLHGVLADAGVRVHTVPIPLGAPLNYGEPVEAAVWQGPGELSFDLIEERIITLLRHAPDAYVRLNLGPEPYYGFHEDHPDAVFRTKDGLVVTGLTHSSPTVDPDTVEENTVVSPSYASETYRRETAKVIEQVGRFLAENDVGKRVIGIHLIGGHDGQWLPHTFGRYDFGVEHVAAYRDYLRTLYEDEKALQEAYDNPSASFDTVMPPEKSDYELDKPFLDPEVGNDRWLMDAFRFVQVGKIGTIEVFADAFDRGIGRPMLNSTYWSDAYHGHGLDHWAMGDLLEVDSIDAIASICDYRNWRRQGRPGAIASAAGSLKLHDKIYLYEVDHRTPHSWGAPDANENADWLGQTHDPLDTLHAARREWGSSFAIGGGGWHYSLSGVGQGFAPFPDGNAEAADLARRIAERPRMNEHYPPVGVFLDERTIDAMTHDDSLGLMTLQLSGNMARDPLSTSGLGYVPYLLSDLDHDDRPDYRITIILGGITMTPEQVSYVEDNLQKDGQIIVVMHAAGQTYAGGVEEAVGRMTGIDVALDIDERVVYRLRAHGNDKLAEQIDFHLSETSGPLIEVVDEDATPLATYAQNDKVAAAVKRHDDWTGVYIAAPGALTPRLLRNLAAEVGIEPTGPEGDMTMAGNGVIVVHGMDNVAATPLQWSGEADLVDVATGETVATSAESAQVDVPFGETRWFFLR